MARKIRLEFAGACYHVLNRGNYRRELFSGQGAAESFQRCLFEAGVAFGWRLHAFVVMSNHFHLALETPEPNLSRGMQWLQTTWAVRFNRFLGVTGRPFQGRYKALHVESGHALAQVAHYIHLNPVRAKLVPVERLLDYRWSSLRCFVGRPRSPCLDASVILQECGGLPDTSAGWRSYIDYLAVLADEEDAQREQKFGRLSRGWAIGSVEFRRDLTEELAQRACDRECLAPLGADRDAHVEAQPRFGKNGCANWPPPSLSISSGCRGKSLPVKKSLLRMQ